MHRLFNVIFPDQVIVPKARNEILGVVIVESGWGSMLPTVVIANLAPAGAAARCGQLNIGDQIIAINGISLVGLPLSTCQTYIKVRFFSIYLYNIIKSIFLRLFLWWSTMRLLIFSLFHAVIRTQCFLLK